MRETTSRKDLSAVIFDMDGLMFDTERLGWRMLNQAGAEFGCHPISMERYTQAIGKTHEETRKIFSEMCDHDYALYNAIEARFWELDRDYIRRSGPPKKPGLLELLKNLQELNVPCAVASSTRIERVREHLTASGIDQYFKVVIGGEQAPASKPDPGIFLIAATQLGESAQRCLVLEDSFAGVTAGRSAGMYVIMVPDILQPTPVIREKADLVLESLTDVEHLIATGQLSFSPT